MCKFFLILCTQLFTCQPYPFLVPVAVRMLYIYSPVFRQVENDEENLLCLYQKRSIRAYLLVQKSELNVVRQLRSKVMASLTNFGQK